MSLKSKISIATFLIAFLPFWGHTSNKEKNIYAIVYFRTKNSSQYSLERPDEFLTSRAIERRIRLSIPLDSLDLPVNQTYVDSLILLGIAEKILYTSKWLNCAVIRPTPNYFHQLSKPWISKVEILTIPEPIKLYFESKRIKNKSTNITLDYLIETGIWNLHNKGLKGNDVYIAVFDAGFKAVNRLKMFEHLFTNNKIVDTLDLVEFNSNVFRADTHGTEVLALLAGNLPDIYVGTAPEASYILIRTEDATRESRLEEFNWLRAAEFADSLGADIINSSLGYSEFDNPAENYTATQLTGDIAICSRAAGIASAKGIVVVSSAGNDGLSPWKYINFPADNPNVFAIGGITSNRTRWPGSSIGTSFHKYKPDFVTRAEAVWVPSIYEDKYFKADGTSFSAPLFTGGYACLLEYFKTLPQDSVRKVLQTYASNSQSPNNFIGYGVPDFYKTFKALTKITNSNNCDFSLTINNTSTNLSLNATVFFKGEKAHILLTDSLGKQLFSTTIYQTDSTPKIIEIPLSNVTIPSILIVSLFTHSCSPVSQKILLYNSY